MDKGRRKKTFFLGDIPNVFKKKGDFRGDLRGFDLVWESATPPTHIWERSSKKTFFLDVFPKGSLKNWFYLGQFTLLVNPPNHPLKKPRIAFLKVNF